MSFSLDKYTEVRNRYSAFGLNIVSEIALPELSIPDGDFDMVHVEIIEGKVPPAIENANVSTPYVQASGSQFLFNLPGKGRILVEHGCRIIVEPTEECSYVELSVYLLCSAFGALFHQRGITVLHSSVVKVGDSCAVFCGESGAGKSTLARCLVERGYRLQGDDLGVIHFHEDKVPYIHPAYPQMKLWSESLDTLGHTSEGLSQVMPDMNKFRIPADNYFHKKPLKLGKVYMLSYGDDSNVMLASINGFRKFNLLMENIYRIQFAHAMGRSSQVFDNLKSISPFLNMNELKRPKSFEYMPNVLDALEADFSTWS